MLTFRSVMRCLGPSRSTWSSRTSALPYWVRPSTTPPLPLSLPLIMPASLPACLGRRALTPSVHGVPVRRQQQGHVVVLAGLGGEDDGYLREECRPMVGHQVVPDREDHAAASLRSRRALILPISAAATSSSVSGSCAMRRRSSARISSGPRPVAQIRKTCPKRSS